VGVSLAHHGTCIAAAIAWSSAGRVPLPALLPVQSRETCSICIA
jgi:hypothetical protein